MDGDVLNSDKSDDEFIGVNEYLDENDAYSDDDLQSLLMRSIIFRHQVDLINKIFDCF